MITSLCANLVAMLVLRGFKVIVSDAQRSNPSPLAPHPSMSGKPKKPCLVLGREGGGGVGGDN